MELNILDKTSLKGVSVWDNEVGYKTPRVLMSRELTGKFLKGDVLDANATSILIEEISGSGTHGDVKKYCDEQIKKLRDEMAQPLGFATLDATGNVPLTQLGNIDTNLYEIVTSLPAVGKNSKIYLVKDTTAPDDENIYYEWCYVDNEWEKIGEVHEDLTGYLKKTQSADDLYTDKSILEGGTLSRSLMNNVTAQNPLITNLKTNLPLVHFDSSNAPLFSSSKNIASAGIPLFAGFDSEYTITTTTGTQKVYATMLSTNQMAAGGYYLTSGDYMLPGMHTVGGGLTRFSTTGIGMGYGMRDDKTKPITLFDWNLISFQSERLVLGLNGIAWADKTKKYIPTAQNSFVHIGHPEVTDEYTHLCPIVQDTVDTSKWYIPDMYLNLKDYAVRDEDNTFTADNTFEGPHAVKLNTGATIAAGQDLSFSVGGDKLAGATLTNEKAEWSTSDSAGATWLDITADKVHLEKDLEGKTDLALTDLTFNKQMDDTYWTYKYGVDGVSLHGKDKRDLVTAAESTAYIGDPSEIADYKYVAPLEEYKPDESGPTGYRVPELYIDSSGYAHLDLENKFTANNTFTQTVTVGDVDTTGAATTTVTGGVVQTDTGTALKTDGLRMNCGKIVGWSDDGITKTPRIALTGNLFGTLRTRPNVVYGANDAILQLEEYNGNAIQKFTPSGIALKGKTNQYLFNCGGSTSKLGGTDDTNTYTNVAPLESYTKADDTTGWRIPADYIDVDHSKYAVLAECNTFTEENIFEKPITVGANGKTEIGDGELYAGDNVGLKEEGLKMTIGKMVGWGETTAATPRVYLTGTATGTVKTVSNVVYGSQDYMLNLDDIMEFMPSGIKLKDKTNQQLYNGAGSMTRIGSNDDTTSYTNVAPLETYTKEDSSTGYRIPSKYIDVDHTAYAVLTEGKENVFNSTNKFVPQVTLQSGAILQGVTTLIPSGTMVTNGTLLANGTTEFTQTPTFDACIKFDGATAHDIPTAYATTVRLGGESDDTVYNYVAPLESYKDGDTTAYRVPAKYIDTEDFNDYLKKTQSADVITNDILSGGTLSKSIANVDTISAAAIKGTTTNAAPLLDVSITDDDAWIARSAIIANEDKSLNNVTLNDDGVFVTSTSSTAAGSTTLTAQLEGSGLYLNSDKCCLETSGSLYLPQTGTVRFGSLGAHTGYDLELSQSSTDTGLLVQTRSTIADGKDLLNLNNQVHVQPLGINFNSGTPKHLLNMYGGSVYIGNYGDSNTYERVAPLVEKTTGSGKYYVPAEYLDIDDSNYAKKNAINQFNAANVFADICTFKSDITFEGNIYVDKGVYTSGGVSDTSGNYYNPQRVQLWDTNGKALPVGTPTGVTKWSAVAPLKQDTTDTSKWYVPEEFINFQTTDFLKKTQSANDVLTTVFKDGTATMPLYDCNINTKLITGTYNNDNPMISATLAGTDTENLWLSSTAVAVKDDLDSPTGITYVKPNGITTTNNSVTLSMGDGEIRSKTSSESKFAIDTAGLKLRTGSAGIMWGSDTNIEDFTGAVFYDSTNGLNVSRFGTISNTDALLTLDGWKFTKSGVTFKGVDKAAKTANDLLTCKQSTVHIGKTGDTTAYTSVAPLVQDTTDTSKWYVPSEYIQSSGGDFLKKTQSGDDIAAEIITGGTLGYALANSTYNTSLIKGTTNNTAALIDVASSNAYAPWTASTIGVYSSADNQAAGTGIQITPTAITNTAYGDSQSTTFSYDGIEVFNQTDYASATYGSTSIDMCFDQRSTFPAEKGLRFLDPGTGSPRVNICGDTSGTIAMTKVDSNIASSSDDLLKLQSVNTEFASAATEYMKFTKSGIVKKDGTAKQLYTEAGGTATIGTTSDTTSYTAVAPLNSSNVVPASYMGLQQTSYTGYISSGNFRVSFLHSSAYSITDAASLTTYLTKVLENVSSGVYVHFPASGSFVRDSKTFIITHGYTWKVSSGSPNLLVSGSSGTSSAACWVLTSGATTGVSDVEFSTYNIF